MCRGVKAWRCVGVAEWRFGGVDRPDTHYKLHIRFELHTWRSLKTLPSPASRAPRSSSRQSIVRRRGPGSCGRCSMARRSWPAGAKSASKKLPSSTTTGLETAVTAMAAILSQRRKKRHCGTASSAATRGTRPSSHSVRGWSSSSRVTTNATCTCHMHCTDCTYSIIILYCD